MKSKLLIPQGMHAFDCNEHQIIIYQKYSFIKQVGYNPLQIAILAVNSETNQKVEIKKITDVFSDLIEVKSILREIKLLKFFDHENIISILDLQRPEHPLNYQDIYIISNFMDTDLQSVICSKLILSEEHIQYFIYQALRGLLYIHSANITHRNLKPSVLLVDLNCNLKINDFGLPLGYQEEFQLKTEYSATRWYLAPEVILNEKQNKSVDIYALGCILAEMFGRQPLFPVMDYMGHIPQIISILGTPNTEDLKFIENTENLAYLNSLPKHLKQDWKSLYPNASSLALDLLENMVQFNPDKRLTVQECLAHPYFEGLHNAETEPVCKCTFDWGWDNIELSETILKGLVYEESLSFHPLQ